MKEKKPKIISKKPILNSEDEKLWQAATKDVKGYDRSNHIVPETPPIKKFQRPRNLSGQITLEINRPQILNSTQSSFQIDGGLRKKFESGELEIDGKIDLHGLTLTEAHRTFISFLIQKIKTKSRFLLVITGKGSRGEKGLIRQNLPFWCEDIKIKNHILSIKSAKPKHGGDGASYILLRKHRL